MATERRAERMRSLPHWRWHLDEVSVTTNGVMHDLWRAVDHEGEALEACVAKTRDRKAALKFLMKTMTRHGHPQVFRHGPTQVLPSDAKGYGNAGRSRDRSQARQSRRQFESAASTTGAFHAPPSSDAIASEIRRSPFLHPQPVQRGACQLQPGQLQDQLLRRSQ